MTNKNSKTSVAEANSSNKRSYINEVVNFENEFSDSPIGFAMRMFKCYQALSNKHIGEGAPVDLEYAIETLGRVVENSLYETGLITPEQTFGK